MLHGLITWGIATLLMFWLLTSAIGSVIGGGFSALGSMTSAAGSGISEAAKPMAQAAGVSPDMVQQQAQAYLQPTDPDPATMSPQDAQKAVASNLVTYEKGARDAPAAKERIINIIAAQMKISHDQAAQEVQRRAGQAAADQGPSDPDRQERGRHQCSRGIEDIVCRLWRAVARCHRSRDWRCDRSSAARPWGAGLCSPEPLNRPSHSNPQPHCVSIPQLRLC